MSDTTNATPAARTASAAASSAAAPAENRADLPEAARALAERRRIIEEIRGFNPTAEHSFLASFATEALQDYLEHLRHARQKSVRLRGWLQLRSAALEEARRQLHLRKAA